jgi:hypothetical protein
MATSRKGLGKAVALGLAEEGTKTGYLEFYRAFISGDIQVGFSKLTQIV